MPFSRRLRVWLLAAVIFAAMVAVVFVGLYGISGRMARQRAPGPSPAPSPSPQTFRPAPDFRLRTFDRRSLALSDLRGKIVILNFWASWCTPCKQEMPNLERAWREFRDRGVVVLGIDVLDDIEDAATFMKALKITYPSVFDPDQIRVRAYRVTALPTTVFIDRELRIRRRFVGGYVGPSGYTLLRREIEELLAASP